MITIDEIAKADINSLSQHTKNEAFYKGTEAILKFISNMIIRVMK